jgi:hypothetical protein
MTAEVTKYTLRAPSFRLFTGERVGYHEPQSDIFEGNNA